MKRENNLLVNSYEPALVGIDETEIIGKRDDDFVRDEKEMEIIEGDNRKF